MKEGFFVNGMHSYGTLGMRILQRNIGESQKDNYIERVPFSSVVHDFSQIYGESTYGERTISYTLEFICLDKKAAQEKILMFTENMKWSGYKKLYDDLTPDYCYKAREPAVSWSENHGVYTLSVNFPAAHEMINVSGDTFGGVDISDADLSNAVLPDVDGDGEITPADSSAIISAYAKLATGESTGFTPDQERKADANMDGAITPLDASLVLRFYSELATGHYTATNEGWAAFLNDVRKGAI